MSEAMGRRGGVVEESRRGQVNWCFIDERAKLAGNDPVRPDPGANARASRTRNRGAGPTRTSPQYRAPGRKLKLLTRIGPQLINGDSEADCAGHPAPWQVRRRAGNEQKTVRLSRTGRTDAVCDEPTRQVAGRDYHHVPTSQAPDCSHAGPGQGAAPPSGQTYVRVLVNPL